MTTPPSVVVVVPEERFVVVVGVDGINGGSGVVVVESKGRSG